MDDNAGRYKIQHDIIDAFDTVTVKYLYLSSEKSNLKESIRFKHVRQEEKRIKTRLEKQFGKPMKKAFPKTLK
ncbi:MAG: hypothetical protein J6X36_10240 [Lachnospiraceae bacterium]|nr:hypothetical protein [Lachnospiraceae bacterium]